MSTRLTLILAGMFVITACTQKQQPQESLATFTIKTTDAKDTISENIYGHFAEHLGRCIYDGIWVGEKSTIPNINGFRKDIIDALKEIDVPVIRWPGGCFADIYHWKDGIGPKELRPKLINRTWGDAVEDNSFGTHEFLEFCSLIDAEPYLALNVGSGTVREAIDWVDYVTSDNNSPMAQLRKKNGREEPWKVKYWGIGNESWGCGGNMDPYFYTSLFKQYSTYCKVPYRIASGGLNFDTDWTKTFMKNIDDKPGIAQGYSFHYYSVCHTWDAKGSATDFDVHEWYLTMKSVGNMVNDLESHIKIMDEYDSANKVALIADEWGNWHDVEPGTNPAFLFQQNTLRDAVSAAYYLNIFNNHCRRVKMANIAQTVNVLQAMILTNADQLVLTPTYYVFKMYKVHQNAVLLPVELNIPKIENGDVKIPAVSVSASKDKTGIIHISIANLDPEKPQAVTCSLEGLSDATKVTGEVITADKINAFNDFGKPETVNIQSFTDFTTAINTLQINLPSKSVVQLTIVQ